MLPSGCDWFGGRVEEVMSRTKVIGMLGGMSWESSAEYYRLANELVRERLGGLHSARIVLASVDFADVEALQVAGRWDEAGAHLADVAAIAVHAAGLSTVGPLGTAFTMEQDFYRERLVRHGLRVLVPPADDRAEVHRVIYEELCLGDVRDESRRAYRDVIARLVAAGAEGVLLACTEIELLISQADSPVPVFPTTRLHVQAAVDAALDGRGPVR